MGCMTSDDCTDMADRYPESTLQAEGISDESQNIESANLPFDFSSNQSVGDR